jgi:Cu2+-exporting ATPase
VVHFQVSIYIPITSGVFLFFILLPEDGAAVMSLSTVIVAVNAQMLLKEMK